MPLRIILKEVDARPASVVPNRCNPAAIRGPRRTLIGAICAGQLAEIAAIGITCAKLPLRVDKGDASLNHHVENKAIKYDMLTNCSIG